MKKKILFVTHSSNQGGGSEYDFEELLKYYSEKKEEYTVHSLFPKGENSDHLSLYCEKYGYYRWGYLPSHYLYGVKNYFRYIFKYFDQIRTIRAFIKDEKYDLCVLNVIVLVWPAFLFAKTQSKVVIFVRENVYPVFLRKLLYKCFKYYNINIITNSKTAYDYYRQITGLKNVAFVYPGIKNSDSSTHIGKYAVSKDNNLHSNNTFKLLNIGSFDKLKNQKLIIDALIEMKKQRFALPDVTFVGSFDANYNYCIGILKSIKENSLTKNIKFLGKLKKKDVHDEIQRSDALIISSVTEGMPISMIEAMKFGKPVLSTRVGGIPEVIKDEVNGLLFGNDPIEVAFKINEIMKDSLLYKELSKRSFDTFRESFKLEDSLLQTEKIFQKLMNS